MIEPDDVFLRHLSGLIGPDAVRSPEPRYLDEPRGRYRGKAAAVVAPRSVEDVSAVVGACAASGVCLVPYSGGTGLVSGQILETGPTPIVLSFERMNAIRSIEPQGNVMVVEAGAILADIHTAAEEVDRCFPLSLASEGSARIGGLLATNAGGTNVLRYGNARDLCLGIEAVMADGRIMHGLSRVSKDNLGYDMRHLLIGSEGTLGLITAASLRLHPRLSETATAWLAVAGPDAALDLLGVLRAALGGAISAFELIHRQGLRFLDETLPDLPQPPHFDADWLVLCDVADGAGSDIRHRLVTVLEDVFARGLAQDGVISQNEAQRQEIWQVRETIPEANRLIGSVSSHDISVPAARTSEFITKANAAIAAISPELRVNCFGHLGDGNLHYNVFPPKGGTRHAYEANRIAIKSAVHDLVHALGGSVAAEHGVGRIKVVDLEQYGDPVKLDMMRKIKASLDPKGILNPGAVLRV